MKHVQNRLFFGLLLLLPSQLGIHFWLSESLVLGRRIDYLSPTIYMFDLVLLLTVGQIALLHKSTLRRHLRLLLGTIFIIIILLIAGFGKVQLLPIYSLIKLLTMAAFAGVVLVIKPRLIDIQRPLAIGIYYTVILAVAQFLLQRSAGGLFYFLGERAFSISTPAIAHLVARGQLLLRPYATFPHPNVMGGYLATILPLFLFARHPLSNQPSVGPALTERVNYFLHHSTTSLLIMGIFLSFSRVAWVAAAGVCLIAAYYARQRRKLLLWAVVGFVTVFVVEEVTIGRFSSLLIVDNESWGERLRLMKAALSMFTASPLWGVGWGRFIPSLPLYSDAPYLLQPVHNVYLLLLAEAGLAGLLFFGVVVITSLRRVIANKRTSLLVSGGVILGLGFFDHYFVTIHQTMLLMSLIVSLSLITYDHV